jgi:hypothetical protein
MESVCRRKANEKVDDCSGNMAPPWSVGPVQRIQHGSSFECLIAMFINGLCCPFFLRES